MDNLEKAPKPVIIVLGIILTVALCTLGLSLSNSLFRMTGVGKELLFLLSRLTIWLFLLMVFLYTRKVEHQPFVGWQNPKYPVYFHLAGVFAILVVLFVGNIIIGLIALKFGLLTKSSRLDEVLTILRKYPPLIIFTSLTAGVVEELIFRGYMMPRLQKLLRSNVLAIVISSLLFGLAHLGYGTVVQVIGPIFIGAVFAVYYSRYRDLHTIIICHFLWDMISLSLKA